MNQNLRNLLVRSIYLAPNGDNSQPFRCYWENETLCVEHDSYIARHRLNYQNYASLLALGALLENVRITAEDNSLDMEIKFIKEDDPLLKVCLSFTPSQAVEKTNLSSLQEQRFTDRRAYEGRDDAFNLEYFENLASSYKASLRIIDKLSPKVLDHFISSDSVFWRDPEVYFDTLHWVRYTKKSMMKTRDGLPYQNLGINIFSAFSLWIGSKSRFLQKFFMLTGGLRASKQLTLSTVKSAGGFVFFYPHEFSPIGLIETGKLAQRFWLELTKIKYAAQPVTLGTLLPYLSWHTNLLKTLPKEIVNIYETGASVMKEELDLPIWGFRWGKVSTPLPEEARTIKKY
jgi:hypothetical protein